MRNFHALFALNLFICWCLDKKQHPLPLPQNIGLSRISCENKGLTQKTKAQKQPKISHSEPKIINFHPKISEFYDREKPGPFSLFPCPCSTAAAASAACP
jgi:hypothetical protein